MIHQTTFDDTTERRWMIRAFIGLVERELSQGGFSPGQNAQRLLGDMMRDGMAAMTPAEDAVQLLGITGTAGGRGRPYALLRNWTNAAKDRLAERCR